MIGDELNTNHFIQIATGYRDWIDALGYPAVTVYNQYGYVKGLLSFLEKREVAHAAQITPMLLKDYISYLQARPNYKRGGSLSAAYINGQISMIKKLTKYLKDIHEIYLYHHLNYLVKEQYKALVLSRYEVQLLYDTVKGSLPYLQLRDRAVLDLYYACGLRRSEALQLDISDIDFETRRLHVRFGKMYMQRYVPFTKTVADRFKEYLEYGRPQLDRGIERKSFLLGRYGKRYTGPGVYSRIKDLKNRIQEEEVKKKDITLHTLRHSIATHLHHAGMSIEQVAEFLGHRSLESTQIYTHLVHEL